MFIPTLNSKCVFKHPFGGGKNCRCQNLLKEPKSYFFVCLSVADSISFSISLTKGLHFAIEKK